MMKGTIKWAGKKGYGWITGQNGQDYFLHISSLLASSAPFDTLKPGQPVVFEVEETSKGPRATQVIAESGAISIRASVALAADL